jgi:hypothetical protein
MENIELGSLLKDSFSSLQRYIDSQLKYNKLLLTQKMSEIFSLIILFVILLGLSGFILIFFSLAFANWYYEQGGSMFHGYLWVTLFYLLIAIVIYLFRNPFIFNPLRILFGNILFRDEATEKTHIPFHSKEELGILIAQSKEELLNETENLKVEFENLTEKLTIPNILVSFGKGLYDSVVTTSNIVKISFLVMRKLFGSKKGKDQIGDNLS